jgi:hypothetical protein
VGDTNDIWIWMFFRNTCSLFLYSFDWSIFLTWCIPSVFNMVFLIIKLQNNMLIELKHILWNSPHKTKLCSEAEFLEEIQTKVLTVFLLAIQSHLDSFALRFLFLQTHATSFSFYCTLLCTVQEKWKSDRNRTFWFKKSIQKPSILRILKIMPRNLT